MAMSKDRPDIGLVMCPIWDVKFPQLGLPLLKAYLRSAGFSAFVYDFAIRLFQKSEGPYREALVNCAASLQDPKFVGRMFAEYGTLVEMCIDELLDSGAKAFGFPLYFCNKEATIAFAERIKTRDPSRQIVFGGPECVRFGGPDYSSSDREALNVADLLVPGEGEMALRSFLGRLCGRTDSPMRGAYVKDGGRFLWAGEGEPVENLDSLPFPDFEDFNLEDYLHPALPTYMTRSCPRRCSFCDVRHNWGPYRTRTGRRVFDEIAHQLERYPHVQSLWFCDPVINADLRELESLCDHILAGRKKGLRSFRWRAFAFVREDMSPRLLAKMAQCGCVNLNLGIESGSQKIVDSMKKGFHLPVAERMIRDVFEAGIQTQIAIMVGFPGELEEDFQQTVSFMRRIAPYTGEVIPSESLTHIAVGTDLHERAGAYGVETGTMHSRFWRTADGKNTYPERFRRHEVFFAEMDRLGIPVSVNRETVRRTKAPLLAEYSRYEASLAATRKPVPPGEIP